MNSVLRGCGALAEYLSKTSFISDLDNVWFQKISIPPPWRELDIRRGGGGSKTQEIPEGRGVGRSIQCPDVLRFNTDSGIDLDVQKSFLTY